MEIEEFFKIMDYSGRLKRLPRNGWLFHGLESCESIADHSYRVNLITLLLCRQIEGVNTERALKMSIIHDLGESILTDIPRETMDLLEEEVKLNSEVESFNLIFTNSQSEYIELIREYNSRETLESRLVYASDKLEMLFQALTYLKNGYTGVKEFFTDLSYIRSLGLDYVDSLVDRIEQEFKALTQG